VHRTGTVDCPVRPYRVFKKASSPTEPEALSSLCQRFLPLCPTATPSLPPAFSDHRRPPSPTVLRLPRAPLPSLLGEQLLLTLTPSQFPAVLSMHLFHLLQILQIPVKSCESSWWNAFNYPYCISLQVLSSFGRVFPPQIAISPKT
jgi:hypothetical protein